MIRATGVSAVVPTPPTPPSDTPTPTPEPAPAPTPSPVMRLPMFIRKFIVDFVETGLAAILALTLVFPTDVASAKQVGIAIGLAMLGAAVSAIRREAPDFIAWVASKVGVANAGQ